MYLGWENGVLLADREMIAAVYEVSQRTVRRRCQPVRHQAQAGQPRGVGGRALYDAQAAAADLAGVAPRPGRALAVLKQKGGPAR